MLILHHHSVPPLLSSHPHPPPPFCSSSSLFHLNFPSLPSSFSPSHYSSSFFHLFCSTFYSFVSQIFPSAILPLFPPSLISLSHLLFSFPILISYSHLLFSSISSHHFFSAFSSSLLSLSTKNWTAPSGSDCSRECEPKSYDLRTISNRTGPVNIYTVRTCSANRHHCIMVCM